MFVNFNILNQLGSPAINSNTFANRPAAGQTGRLFVSTDTYEIYRDNGTTWDLIGGPGSSTITGTGTATQVAYFTSSQAIGSSANLFWDSSNNRLGINTNTPTDSLTVTGSAYVSGDITGNRIIKIGGLGTEYLMADGTTTTGSGITLTTTGNSGASTLIGSVLNVPNYTLAGLGGVPTSRTLTINGTAFDLTADRSWSVGTVTQVAATAGTGISIAGSPINTSGTLTITNTAPDQTVVLSAGTGISVTGTYPSFTITNTAPSPAGAVTGSGTATQVAFWSSASALSSSANLYWDNVTNALGINTNTPSAELDVHGTGVIAQFNTTSATGNVNISLQRSNVGIWRIGDTYNGGANYFELHNTVGASNAIEIIAANNKKTFYSSETYTSGVVRGNYFQHTISVANNTTFTTTNSISALGASLIANFAGNATINTGSRSGSEAYNTVNFTGAGTLTVNQSTTLRAYDNFSTGWAFAGSATGTITHLSGIRILYPSNTGSAINVTNNYGLVINDQAANLGTVTYTNRWGIYQEGVSDLNYMAANLLLGSTTNSGEKLQVTGSAAISGNLAVDTNTLYVDSAANNVGIGTTAPTDILNLSYSNNNGGNVGLYVKNINTGTAANYAGLYAEAQNGTVGFRAHATTTTALGGYGVTGTSTAHPLLFVTSDAERMRISSTGNVGIGTASPGNRLHVYSTGSELLRLEYSGATGGNYIQLKNSSGDLGYFGYGSTSSDQMTIFQGKNADLAIFTNSAERMRITSGGNVGIGTTSPAGQFEVYTDGYRRLYTSNIDAYTIRLVLGTNSYIQQDAGNEELRISQQYGSGKITFYTGATNSERMRITSGGNVLIGTTTDGGQKLQVNGDIKTAAPTGGTAAAWKLGSRVASSMAFDSTQYIEVDIGGTLYKLALATPA
jgi:hypothetical protein